MSFASSSRPRLGGLAVAAVLTASSLAHADVPSTTWSALRDRDVIVATESGKVTSGKLIDVQPTMVTLLQPGGESLQISRESIRFVRASGSEAVVAFAPDAPPSPRREIAPGVFEWREGDPIPPGFRPVTQVRRGPVIGGAVAFGTAWLGSAITAGFTSAHALAIPVVGPWVTAAPLFHGGSMNATWGILCVADGIQQAVGLTLLIYGIAAPRTVLRAGFGFARPWWVPTPVSLGSGGVGVGISGTM